MKLRIRTILCALVIILAVSIPTGLSLAAGDDGATCPGITQQSVENSLTSLNADGKYLYDESALDEPIWVQQFRDWLANLQRRLISGDGTATAYGGFRAVSIVIVAALAILVIFVIAMRIRQKIARIGSRAAGGADSALAAEGLWDNSDARMAMELAAAGSYREAVSMLFRSALIGLDNLGWIRYRRSGASRGYLRQLRRSQELYPLFRDLLGRFEVAYYRKSVPDDDDWTFMYSVYQNLAQKAATNRSPSYAGKD